MPDLTATRLRELLDYDPESGVFTWKVDRRRVRAGDTAGIVNCYGYHKIGIDYRIYQSHRLAWLYVHGEWPPQQIDHRNGVRSDNRLSNLRAATPGQNQHNRGRVQRGNRSGLLGVSRRGRLFRSQIAVGRRSIHLGYFPTAELAHDAYLVAKRDLHPFWNEEVCHSGS